MKHFIFSESLEQAKKAGFWIIDIRRPEEWEERKLPQADQEIEMSELVQNPEKYLPKNQKTLLVCKAGVRAINSAEYLQGLGFKNVFAFPSQW